MTVSFIERVALIYVRRDLSRRTKVGVVRPLVAERAPANTPSRASH